MKELLVVALMALATLPALAGCKGATQMPAGAVVQHDDRGANGVNPRVLVHKYGCNAGAACNTWQRISRFDVCEVGAEWPTCDPYWKTHA